MTGARDVHDRCGKPGQQAAGLPTARPRAAHATDRELAHNLIVDLGTTPARPG